MRMEEAGRPKRKKYYQADFLTRPVLLWGALLFLVCQVMKLIRLFSDAVAYQKANGVAPEEFTMGAVLAAVLLAALAGWIFAVLLRQKKGRSHLRRGNRFLLLDALLVIFGFWRAVAQLVLFFQNFEILFLLDVLALAGGVVAPAVILFLADRQRIPPGDVLLIIIGAGAMGFSVLSFIMVAISIGKDYTLIHAIPELAFRLGVFLFGFSALRTALKLRAEAPIVTPVVRKDQPEKPKKPRRELHLKLFDNLPGFDDEEPEELLDDEADDGPYTHAPEETEPDVDDAPEPYAAYAPAGRGSRLPRGGAYDAPVSRTEPMPAAPGYDVPAPDAAPARPHRRPEPDEKGRITCPSCRRRFPGFLGVCPHCGQDIDEAVEESVGGPDGGFAYGDNEARSDNAAGRNYAAEEPRSAYAPAARSYDAPAPRTESARVPRVENKLTCPDCGMRFPAYLGVCPRCGRDVFEE